jgi:hypothetical protein
LVKDSPGAKTVPSLIVTSLMKEELSQVELVLITAAGAETFWAAPLVGTSVGLANSVAVEAGFSVGVGVAAAAWAERVIAATV